MNRIHGSGSWLSFNFNQRARDHRKDVSGQILVLVTKVKGEIESGMETLRAICNISRTMSEVSVGIQIVHKSRNAIYVTTQSASLH